jgi:hypothetical protein
MPLLPGAHYGKIDETPEDEDAPLPEVPGIDDDDDKDRPADPSLIAMLGFDPDEIDWDAEDEPEDEDETVENADGTISKRKKSR